MTKILISWFCLFPKLVFGQIELKHDKVSQTLKDIQNSIVDSTDFYISRLNCNSVTLTPTYYLHFVLDSNGQRLVNLNDRNLNKKLLSHLYDSSKFFALHIILASRLKYDGSAFTYEFVWDTARKYITVLNVSCNNIHWYYLELEDTSKCFFHIEKYELDKANRCWTEKLKN